MMRFFFLLFALGSLYTKECTFLPPKGWEIAQLKTPSPHIKIGFVGKGSGEFRPSLNLALEEGVDVSLKEYVKAVKELQMAESGAAIRDLGPFSMRCGSGRLLEITNPSPWGELRILQALFVEEKNAYILTAAVLKKDFPKFQKELLESLGSLTLTDDLFSQIKNPEERNEFVSFFATLGTRGKEEEWQMLQTRLSSHATLGPYWVFLVLQKGHTKIYSDNNF